MSVLTKSGAPLCLVIGGNGFLGGHISASLLNAGYRVRVFDRTANRDEASSLLQHQVGDLARPEDLQAAIRGAKYIFHCAYATVPRTAAADPRTDVQKNLLPLLSMLEEVGAQGVCQRIIYLSSGGTVYGPMAQSPITEDEATQPSSAYGISKLASEKYLGLYAARFGFEAVVLRISNPYGPGQNTRVPQGVIGHFLQRIRDEQGLEIWGDGSVVRDYFFAEDLRPLALRLVKEVPTQGIFNIGSGVGRSLLALVDELREVTQRPFSTQHREAQSYDCPVNILDVNKAAEELGWRATTSFREGLARTWRAISSVQEER